MATAVEDRPTTSTDTTSTPDVAPAKDSDSAMGRRVAAALADTLLLGLLWVGLSMLTGGAETSSGGGQASATFALAGPMTLGFLVAWLAYFTGLEAFNGGQTLGKQLMSVRVVAGDGGPLTLGRALGRNVLRIVDQLPAFYLLGFVVAMFNGDRKRIGDLAASTRVVDA